MVEATPSSQRGAPHLSKNPERVGENTTGQTWGRPRYGAQVLGGLCPPSQRPGYRLNLSESGMGLSQGTILPLGPELASRLWKWRLGTSSSPAGPGKGPWQVRPPTSSPLPLHMPGAPFPISFYTHFWSIPTPSCVSGFVVAHINYAFQNQKNPTTTL